MADPLNVFNIVVGTLVVIGIIFIRQENQQGLVYKIKYE